MLVIVLAILMAVTIIVIINITSKKLKGETQRRNRSGEARQEKGLPKANSFIKTFL